MEQLLLELHNESPKPLQIWLEPWGEELTMKPGATWRLTDVRTPPTSVTISYRQDGISVHTMPSGKIRLMDGASIIWQA